MTALNSPGTTSVHRCPCPHYLTDGPTRPHMTRAVTILVQAVDTPPPKSACSKDNNLLKRSNADAYRVSAYEHNHILKEVDHTIRY